ncbi:uncharacterized protein LOC125103890 [Lutra lutra]|uniref:uncharacterized protein LOC125103890 n=1 Tax=Lutra lutra TaxID=9657 RepID=UPI001FD3C6F5|nr:uncharacterized protein LOC125103890 [Lutra lutra]
MALEFSLVVSYRTKRAVTTRLPICSFGAFILEKLNRYFHKNPDTNVCNSVIEVKAVAKVTELERASGLGSELRPSDSNPERLRQEIGRTVPPGALLCTGLSPDKEVSGEEEPGTKKICADVENRKWRQLGFSQPPEASSTGNPAEGQAGRERGPREPPSRCVRLCARCWAAAVPTLQDLTIQAGGPLHSDPLCKGGFERRKGHLGVPIPAAQPRHGCLKPIWDNRAFAVYKNMVGLKKATPRCLPKASCNKKKGRKCERSRPPDCQGSVKLFLASRNSGGAILISGTGQVFIIAAFANRKQG